MTHTRLLKTAGVITAFTAIILAGTMTSSKRVSARDDDRGDQAEESKIRRGFEIAPVHLNLERKNRALVGLGSYIVNAVGDCNGCHSAGPTSEFASPGGNPYFRTPPFSGTKQVNQLTYLGGGRDFGPVGSVAHLYSRNLTPDNTGLPVGGHTYKEFVEIMRLGAYLTRSPIGSTTRQSANCRRHSISDLQVMDRRFPNMTIRSAGDLRVFKCNPL